MFKIFVFLSLFALAFAKPGYIHSAPVLTSYQHTATVPIAHVVRPLVTAHSVVSSPVIHAQPTLLHGSLHGSYGHLY
ncbi:hypothetical protein DOY81_008099 [Sarcophaga bullata]|nr:hypothetical protein DOY81_008099 [Sarcophaga bullata]